jgi:hypothetical protein
MNEFSSYIYCECLGTTWTGNLNPARDPIVFFRTQDMADTSKWRHFKLPAAAELDGHQAKAYAFSQPAHSLAGSGSQYGLGYIRLA